MNDSINGTVALDEDKKRIEELLGYPISIMDYAHIVRERSRRAATSSVVPTAPCQGVPLSPSCIGHLPRHSTRGSLTLRVWRTHRSEPRTVLR